jgi:hypothetical protein
VVDLSIRGDALHVEVLGLHKLWALKSRLRIPLRRVRSVRYDPGAASGWWRGWRLPGTHVPGLITAGSYYQDGRWTFWDVRDPSRTVVVELDRTGGRYDRLVVEVEQPVATASRLDAALRELHARGAAG